MTIASVRDVFSLDLRALAILRINLALLVIIDLIGRIGDIRAFYTDFGLLPRGAFLEKFANSQHLSLHLSSGRTDWIALLFCIHLLAAIAMLIGYRTKIATFITWALLISLHSRNPMILNGGDVLLRMGLFWAMFVPTHFRYSMDAAVSEVQVANNRWFGAGSIAILTQVLLVYLCTVYLKTGEEWWPLGTASYYALAIDQLTTPFGIFLSSWHEPLRISTYIVYGLELAAVPLLLCPLFFNQVRLLTVLALCFMHLQFDLTMRIGLFPWVDIALLISLIPTAVWDKLHDRLQKPERRGVVFFYDQDCGFCRRMVLVLRTFLWLPYAEVRPSQEDETAHKILNTENSWCFRDASGTYLSQSSGIFALGRTSPLTGFLIKRLPTKDWEGFGDRVYRAIANRRGSLGRLLARLLPWRELKTKKTPLLGQALVLLALGLVIFWNIQTLETHISIPKSLKTIAYTLRLDQKWNMFAPAPMKNDGYFIVDGRLVDGTKVDVYQRSEHAVSWDKPKVVAWQHKNARWRKYMMNIWLKKYKDHRLYWGKYMCRSWNEDRSGDRRLHTFELVFMRERTMPPGQEPELKKYTLWRHNCLK